MAERLHHQPADGIDLFIAEVGAESVIEVFNRRQRANRPGMAAKLTEVEFKKLMDDTIAQAQTSGEAEKWFDKWFKNPIPPKNLNMNFELSDEMKALFKAPNDKALN